MSRAADRDAGRAGAAPRARAAAITIVTAAAMVAAIAAAAGGCKQKKAGLAVPPPDVPAEAKMEMLILPGKGDAIDIRVLFMTGSVDDPKGREGLTALTASLMAEGGTESHPYPELLDLLYPMAAEIDVQVDKEMTVFTSRVHRDHLDAFLPLLADVITHPAFDAKAFDRLKTDQINYIEKGLRQENDEQLGIQALDLWLHEGDPYGHLVEGTVKGVGSILPSDVRDHWGKVFTRDRMVVGMAGAVDESVAARVKEAFKDLAEKGSPRVEIPAPAPVSGVHVRIVEKETDSTAISMGYPIGVGRDHPDYHALWLAQSALGEHRQSTGVLFQTLREKRGLNYGDYAYIEPYVRHGEVTKPVLNIARKNHDFSVWIRPVQAKHGLFATRLALWALDRFAKNGLDADMLARSKGFLEGYTRVFEESMDRRLGYALDDLYYGAKEKAFLAAARDAFAGATLDQVNAAVKAHIGTANMKVVIVTKDAEGLKKALSEGAKAEIAYDTPKPPEVIEQDKEIASFDPGFKPEWIEIVKVEDLFEE